jgi:Helicase conserved C-terminal domain/PLD-like domain/SNF2-related domain
MPTIYDNKTQSLAPALRATLDEARSLDVCVGYLNLRGWKELADAVDSLPWAADAPATRVLVGMSIQPGDQLRQRLRIRPVESTWDGVTNEEIPALRSELLGELRSQLTVGFPTDEDESVVRQLARQLREGRVAMKFFACAPLHAKLYLAHLPSLAAPRKAFVGSSNLTLAGLVHQGELNVDVLDEDATDKLYTWFKAQWGRSCAVAIDAELVDVIESSWVSEFQPEPYLVHLKLAYELARDAREGIRDYDIPESLAGVLLLHQADAVRVASKMLERRRGVMIGDVVGLGKTLIAVAVGRLLQEQGSETLVVCPKNLVKMWQDHFHTYHLYGRVVSLSMAHAELPDTPRHRLLVIDESHNLRNEETRGWEAVRKYIELNEPRVMLVTATPYNKDYGDVAGQLRLFLDPDADLGVRPDALIEAIGEVAVAQRAGGRLTTLRAFEQSDYPEDWQRIMSLFLVRRTRRFVEERYGETDANGRTFLRFADGSPFYFPERVPRPLPYEGGVDDPGDRLASEETVDELATLELPRYRLVDYLQSPIVTNSDADLEAIDKMRRGRGNLHGFIRTSLLKRLASSGPAFLLSVERHILRNLVVLHALESGLPFPFGTVESARWDFGVDSDAETLPGLEVTLSAAASRDNAEWRSFASERYEDLQRRQPAGVVWLSSNLFTPQLAKDLEHDVEVLRSILEKHGEWDPGRDSKVRALARLISEDHTGEKVLVFSEYADTAEYVARQLRTELDRAGVDTQVEVATGGSSDPTVLARRFSPRSNEELGGLPAESRELDVLVATDVLSEGQNLQDAAVVVNYDLPWTIIRIIQRAGRVDRVGQQSPTVWVYSFLPQEGVEKIIRLRARCAERLRENARAFESDERFFDSPDELDATIRGLFDGTADLSADEDPTLVDWSSHALAIWDQASNIDRTRAASLPNVVYSTRAAGEAVGPGVLVYARTALGMDAIAWTDPQGDVRALDPFQALTISRVDPGIPALERRPDHHRLVKKAIELQLLDAVRSSNVVALSGVQRRLYESVKRYLDSVTGQFDDTPELRHLMDAVYNRPLRESAKARISRALRERSIEDLVAMLLSMQESDELLVDLSEQSNDELRIVCSLGVRTR